MSKEPENDFEHEDPTPTEVTETLEQTLARLTGRTPTRERPSVRMKAVTKPPETP